MAQKALIIGDTGQIGSAAASALTEAGWEVTGASRRGGRSTRSIPLDRDDTEALADAAHGVDLVVDTVAFNPYHAQQLLTLDVGSLVVISTASVYLGANGTYLDIAEDHHSFPDFPIPIDEHWPTIDNSEQTYSPLKAAMERDLLQGSTPASVLRPGAIHGPHSPALREWYFIKRVLDARPHAVLAFDGSSRFSTTSTANLAALIVACARNPGSRALNAVDDEGLAVADIGRSIFEAMGHDAPILTFPGPPQGELGASPWGVSKPIVLSMDAARKQVGYAPAASYAESVIADIEWVTRAVADAEAAGESWQELFPGIVSRYGADGWFPYDAEDSFVAG